MAIVSASAFAQTKATPQAQASPAIEKQAQESTDKLKAELKLTPEQCKKILAINKYYYTQTEALNTPGKGTAEDAKVKLKVLTQVKDDEINSALTTEQRTKLGAKK